MKSYVYFLLLALTLPAAAADLPTSAEFLGYEIGDRFTPHRAIIDYFQMLDERSPRLTLHQFGQTWEGRPLYYAVITSEENLRRIDQIKAATAAINHPEDTTPGMARTISDSSPVVVWLSYGIHGNEASSSEAAVLTAEWLTGPDPEVLTILRDAVVILDPMQNPDGHERYVSGFQQRTGQQLNPAAESWEHREPWPGGRYNHYLFDMNRDWAWMTQIETRARVAAFREWNPQVFVDFHEMNSNWTYFFPPFADPINRNIGVDAAKWLETFGKANSEAFTMNGWPFFVGETYDLFYPGYGDSWPSLHGAVGMTYEVAGGGLAGIVLKRDDETELTLAERATKHFTTSTTTIRTAAEHRRELLLHNYATLQRNLQENVTTYLIAPGAPMLPKAMALLRDEGIEARELAKSTEIRVVSVDGDRVSKKKFEEGTVVVSTRQPLGALARALLERSPELDSRFVERQRERVEADESDQFYDLTGWSIIVTHGLEAWRLEGEVDATLLREPVMIEKVEAPPAKIGWIIDATDPFIYQAVGQLLRRQVRIRIATAGLDHSSRKFPRGSIVILKSGNDGNLEEAIRGISTTTSARFHAVDQIWDGGTPIGSTTIRPVRDPQIGLVAGDGTSPASLGSLWYTLDVEAPIPHTLVGLDRLGSMNLDDFRVLVFPDGSGYGRLLGEKDIEALKRWIRTGGTIVAVGGAASWLRSEDVEISAATTWTEKANEDEKKKAELARRKTSYSIPGGAFRSRINERSYLTFALDRPPAVFLAGATTLLPVDAEVENVVTIDEDDPVLSGLVWPESVERVKGSAWLIDETVGEGHVISFADEPNFRAFWRATMPLFLNAVLYSPSF